MGDACRRYIFIDRNRDRCAALETLKTEFPELADAIRVARGEANREIQKICGRNWSKHRAVLFLDPYGMQVEWSTIEAVAATKPSICGSSFPSASA